MRKGLSYLFVFMIILNCIIVVSQPAVSGDKQYEELQENIDKIPLDDSGDFDREKFNTTAYWARSGFEKNIDAVNLWLAENASWLKFIFRTMPEISLLFFLNFYIIIIAFTYIILNADEMWEILFDEKNTAQIFGVGVFAILFFLNAYVYLAELIVKFLTFFWNYIIPVGFWVSIILFIILLIALIVAFPFLLRAIPTLFKYVGKLFGKKFVSSGARKAGGGEVARVVSENEKLVKDLEQLGKEQKAYNRAAYQTSFDRSKHNTKG